MYYRPIICALYSCSFRSFTCYSFFFRKSYLTVYENSFSTVNPFVYLLASHLLLCQKSSTTQKYLHFFSNIIFLRIVYINSLFNLKKNCDCLDPRFVLHRANGEKCMGVKAECSFYSWKWFLGTAGFAFKERKERQKKTFGIYRGNI